MPPPVFSWRVSWEHLSGRISITVSTSFEFISPLRERVQNIPELCGYLLKKLVLRKGGNSARFRSCPFTGISVAWERPGVEECPGEGLYPTRGSGPEPLGASAAGRKDPRNPLRKPFFPGMGNAQPFRKWKKTIFNAPWAGWAKTIPKRQNPSGSLSARLNAAQKV